MAHLAPLFSCSICDSRLVDPEQHKALRVRHQYPHEYTDTTCRYDRNLSFSLPFGQTVVQGVSLGVCLGLLLGVLLGITRGILLDILRKSAPRGHSSNPSRTLTPG